MARRPPMESAHADQLRRTLCREHRGHWAFPLPTRVRRRCLWSVLAVALGLLNAGVSALEVITPKEIYVVYGTQGVLSCKFKSKITTGPATTVSWSFRPGEIHTTVSFFYFVDGQVFLGDFPLFKNRVIWAGDLHKKDASIKIQDMQYNHNGTYICDVKNPPDMVSEPGYILLSVVNETEPTPPPTPQPRPPPPGPQPPRPPLTGPQPRTQRPQPPQKSGTPFWLVLVIVFAVILGLIFLILITLQSPSRCSIH